MSNEKDKCVRCTESVEVKQENEDEDARRILRNIAARRATRTLKVTEF